MVRRQFPAASLVLAVLAVLAVGPAVAANDGNHDGSHATPPLAARPDRNAAWQKILAKPSLATAVAFDDQGRSWQVTLHDRHLWLTRPDGAPPARINTEPEHILGDGENRPKLAVRGDAVYVSYTRGLATPMSGDIRFVRSTDGGKTFAAPVTVNDNREVISHRFDAMAVDGQGRIFIAWLDKRDLSAAQRESRPYRGAAVYYAESVDGGASFAANRKLADHSCECCRVAVAVDKDGSPVTFWRHIFDGGIRDFAIARPGEAVRRTTEDGWRIDACPHHGGDLAIDGDGGRHLAWFTGAEGNPGLFYRRQDGDAMTKPVAFGNLDRQPGHPAVIAAGTRIVLAWQEFDGSRTLIQTMASADRGDTWGTPTTAASTAGASDYPRLTLRLGRPVLAWNTADEGLRLIELEAQ